MKTAFATFLIGNVSGECEIRTRCIRPRLCVCVCKTKKKRRQQQQTRNFPYRPPQRNFNADICFVLPADGAAVTLQIHRRLAIVTRYIISARTALCFSESKTFFIKLHRLENNVKKNMGVVYISK